MLLLPQNERLGLLAHVGRRRFFVRPAEVGGQCLGQLVGKLCVAGEFVRQGVVVGGVRRWLRCEVQEGWVSMRLPIATFVVDESAEIGGEFGAEGAIRVNMHGVTLLVEQEVLARVDVVAA